MADNTKERREGMKTLETKIENLTSVVNKAIERWDKSAEQVVASQIAIARLETEQRTMCDDINMLEKKSNLWDGINSIFIVIAGILGFTK